MFKLFSYLSILFIGGAIAVYFHKKLNPILDLNLSQVTIINESGKDIKKAILKEKLSIIEVNYIPVNSDRTILFECNGENSYSLKVIFEDGDMLTSICGYFEYGLVSKETVKKTKIEHWDNWSSDY